MPSFGFDTDRISLWKWCRLRGALVDVGKTRASGRELPTMSEGVSPERVIVDFHTAQCRETKTQGFDKRQPVVWASLMPVRFHHSEKLRQ